MLKIIIYIISIYIVVHSEAITPLPKNIEFDREKAKIGYYLFHELKLSRDGTVSCATCHQLLNGGADGRENSFGVYQRKGVMNAPTVLNSSFNFKQFWNGRVDTLKEQAIAVLHNVDEMDMNRELIEFRINSSEFYRSIFSKVYGKNRINFENIVDSIVEFEKSLVTPDSRFDKYLRGDLTAITDKEKDGYKLFKTLGCIMCHNGVNIGGNSFQKIGTIIPFIYSGKRESEVHDRHKITGKTRDKNIFKVPSLRNIGITSPYLHNGSIVNLRDVITDMGYHNLGILITDEDAIKIELFLHSLTGETPEFLKRFL